MWPSVWRTKPERVWKGNSDIGSPRVSAINPLMRAVILWRRRFKTVGRKRSQLQAFGKSNWKVVARFPVAICLIRRRIMHAINRSVVLSIRPGSAKSNLVFWYCAKFKAQRLWALYWELCKMDALVSVSTTSAAKKSQVRRYGRKAPFTQADIAAIRTKLALGSRDRALLETALCTALRASDLLRLRRVDVEDAAGTIRARVVVGQQKTRKGVEVNLGPAAAALAAHIAAARLAPEAPLFSAHRRRRAQPLTVEAFRSLVKTWADMAGHRDVSKYAAHSTRRTLAAKVYARSKDVGAVRHLLGHASTAATAAYLGVDVDAALDLALECAL